MWDVEPSPSRQARKDRLALEPVSRFWWHQQQAAQAEKDGEWFAAAFHLQRLRLDRPEDPSLLQRLGISLANQGRWELAATHLAQAHQRAPNPTLGFRLALAQASAGDVAGYRHTCEELLRRRRAQAVAAGAGLFFSTAPNNAGSLALSAPLSSDPKLQLNMTLETLRACLLRPEAADFLPHVTQLLPPPAEQPYGWGWTAAALCRLKRHDQAAPTLQGWVQHDPGPLAQLYLALTEHGRGNRDQARRLLDQAVQTDWSSWSWEERQELELLRREVENLLTPPRMEKLPGD
jgi:tetratricopeptide (TPR) repeat protein